MSNNLILNFLKKILPPFLLDFFLTFLININFYILSNDKVLAKNKLLKKTTKNKAGVLLATGPSIKYQNLKKLKNFDCFSLSSFFFHKDLKIIKPKFHFLAPYHEPLSIKDWIKWIKLADSLLPKETKIVLSIKDKNRIAKFNLLKNREIFYLYFSPFVRIKNTIDITKPLPSLQTSPLMVLPFMIYMGYKTIYLVGCDSNNLKNYGKNIQNFYSQKLEVKRGSDKPWKFGIIKELENNLRVFNEFNNYKIFCEKNNIKIINCSKNSWLDFFDKENFDDLFENKK
mgnify:FL=1